VYVPSLAYPLCSLEQYLLVQYRATTSTCTVLYVLLADSERGVVGCRHCQQYVKQISLTNNMEESDRNNGAFI